jgi:DNA-binding NtrC family response regulator
MAELVVELEAPPLPAGSASELQAMVSAANDKTKGSDERSMWTSRRVSVVRGLTKSANDVPGLDPALGDGMPQHITNYPRSSEIAPPESWQRMIHPLGERLPRARRSEYRRHNPTQGPHVSTPGASRPHRDATETIARRPPAPLGVVLRPIDARSSVAELKLDRGRCVVGAGADADLVIDHKTVSRRHAELVLVPEGVAVRDLGSRNGTFYLGQRVEKMVLSPGSRLRLGSVELAIEPDLSVLGQGDEDEAPSDAYRGLVGGAPAMQQLYRLLARLEGSLVNVLVEGESGVGKELVAHAIHDGSVVATGPLVVMNCGAIGRELVLSELFGHTKGAFTGASEARMGAFEAADGGTLFLDEVGELPLDAQPTLLRALEAGEIKPLGSNDVRRVKVRVVAATNRDLAARVQQGAFREDLYYRLAVVKLEVPSLAERSVDVPMLARHFARLAGAAELPDDVVQTLASRVWRGNARELNNAVLAYLAIGMLPDEGAAPGGLLEAVLRQTIDGERPYQAQKDAMVQLFSRVYFETVMARAGHNQSEAARLSGVERSYLSKLLGKYGVKS